MAKRRQSPLLKLKHSSNDNCYETNIEDCKFWFRILNEEIFNNKLYLPEVDIRWRRKAWALYQYPDSRDSKDVPLMLLLNKKYRSKKFFVEVLAHELIHHYQFLYNEPVGHGPSFVRWEDKFNRKGINLYRVYVE